MEASNYTSIDAPYDVDEWKLSGLTQRSSQCVSELLSYLNPSYSAFPMNTGLVLISRIVKPPHVAESAFSMECEVMHWYDIKTDNGDPANTVIIGRVKLMHVVSLPPVVETSFGTRLTPARKIQCSKIRMLSN